MYVFKKLAQLLTKKQSIAHLKRELRWTKLFKPKIALSRFQLNNELNFVLNIACQRFFLLNVFNLKTQHAYFFRTTICKY